MYILHHKNDVKETVRGKEVNRKPSSELSNKMRLQIPK